MCQVRIENGAGVPLDLHYQVGPQRVNLGVADPGTSYSIGVPCGEVFFVSGSTSFIAVGGPDHYRSRGTAEANTETLIKLTIADRVR